MTAFPFTLGFICGLLFAFAFMAWLSRWLDARMDDDDRRVNGNNDQP